MKSIILCFVCLLFLVLGACSQKVGLDAIFSGETVSYESEQLDCNTCHGPGDQYDPREIDSSSTHGKHVQHVAEAGFSCEKCHFDYPESATHMDGNDDTGTTAAQLVRFDSTNSNGAWTVEGGPGTGYCSSLSCHGAGALDWYGSEVWVLPDCVSCHDTLLGSRRQVLGAGGDFEKESHHVIDYSNRNSEIITKDDCLVCHDMEGHMAGTIRLNDADTASNVIIYDPDDPSVLEEFCLSCHDADGAAGQGAGALSPFSSSSAFGTIPNEAGGNISGYWNGTDTVHKMAELSCMGSGAPGTGCHGDSGQVNAHGSSNRGLLTSLMNFPPSTVEDFEYDNYKLCFDCHDAYPSVAKEIVLGYKEGGNYDVWWAPTPYYTTEIKSLFRERYFDESPQPQRPYNDTIWGDPYIPLHNYHLGPDGWMVTAWKYRGDSTETGRPTCTTCHNVHGTNGTVRSTYDEFGITAFTNGADEYKKLVPVENYQNTVFKNYPVNCNTSCHSIVPGTSYWNTPSDE